MSRRAPTLPSFTIPSPERWEHLRRQAMSRVYLEPCFREDVLEPYAYRYDCPGCGTPHQIAAQRLTYENGEPGKVTIKGPTFCLKDCGFGAEVANGIGKSLLTSEYHRGNWPLESLFSTLVHR